MKLVLEKYLCEKLGYCAALCPCYSTVDSCDAVFGVKCCILLCTHGYLWIGTLLKVKPISANGDHICSSNLALNLPFHKSFCPFQLYPINHFSPSLPSPFLLLYNAPHAGNQAAEHGAAPVLTLLRVPPSALQPIPDTSPMKRSVSTLTPQRPHAMHLYEYSLERMPPEQGHHHHHHRCHRRKEKKQKSLDRSPHQLADGEAGKCFADKDLSLVLSTSGC